MGIVESRLGKGSCKHAMLVCIALCGNSSVSPGKGFLPTRNVCVHCVVGIVVSPGGRVPADAQCLCALRCVGIVEFRLGKGSCRRAMFVCIALCGNSSVSPGGRVPADAQCLCALRCVGIVESRLVKGSCRHALFVCIALCGNSRVSLGKGFLPTRNVCVHCVVWE